MRNENLLIVGASSTLGIGYIRAYATEYSKIIAHCNTNATQLREIAREGNFNIDIIESDLSSNEGAALLVEFIEASRLQIDTIAFFAAPRLQLKRFHKLEWEEFLLHLNVQAKASFIVLKYLLPKMAMHKRGKVVFVLSSVLDGKPPQGVSDYMLGKYAMLALMKSAAAEYASKSICINAVSPSMMETKFVDGIPGSLVEINAEAHPRGANAKPNEIIPIVRFLLSKDSAFITGQNIIATGGA